VLRTAAQGNALPKRRTVLLDADGARVRPHALRQAIAPAHSARSTLRWMGNRANALSLPMEFRASRVASRLMRFECDRRDDVSRLSDHNPVLADFAVGPHQPPSTAQIQAPRRGAWVLVPLGEGRQVLSIAERVAVACLASDKSIGCNPAAILQSTQYYRQGDPTCRCGFPSPARRGCFRLGLQQLRTKTLQLTAGAWTLSSRARRSPVHPDSRLRAAADGEQDLQRGRRPVQLGAEHERHTDGSVDVLGAGLRSALGIRRSHHPPDWSPTTSPCRSTPVRPISVQLNFHARANATVGANFGGDAYTVTTIAGVGRVPGTRNGVGSLARFAGPTTSR